MEAGRGGSCTVEEGELLRIVDVAGSQVCDFTCFNRQRTEERLSTGETVIFNDWTLTLTVGSRFMSNLQRPMFEIVADDAQGAHDPLYAACSPAFYARYANDPDHPSCRENLRLAAAPFGIPETGLPDPINLFQNTVVAPDRQLIEAPAVTKPGDAVVLRALMDAIVVVSACPYDLSPESGHHGTAATPVDMEVMSETEFRSQD